MCSDVIKIDRNRDVPNLYCLKRDSRITCHPKKKQISFNEKLICVFYCKIKRKKLKCESIFVENARANKTILIICMSVSKYEYLFLITNEKKERIFFLGQRHE